VSLKDNGERDFTFYRNPSSDLFLEPSDIDGTIFNSGDILHFCSVDLIDYPVKKAHLKAIEYALKNNLIISFDPNLRLSLWDDECKLKQTVMDFIPYAHIIKVSDEELFFLTEIESEEFACKSLFKGNVQLIIVTKGKDGAVIYTKDNNIIISPGIKVKSIDTTGAGDAFIGSFLYQLLRNNITTTTLLDNPEQYLEMLNFSNLVASIVVTKYGAIPAMPTFEEGEDLQYEK
jgi:fructokinase